MENFPITKKILIQAEAVDRKRIEELASAVLGAERAYTESGLNVLKLPGGCLIEMYASFMLPDYLRDAGNAIVSFKVENVSAARETALDLGFDALTEKVCVCETLSYCYVRTGEGTIIGLYQEG